MKTKLTKASKGVIVKANGNIPVDKTPGSKGVKPSVNPKAAASSTAKKPSKARSKAPKKATPGKQ